MDNNIIKISKEELWKKDNISDCYCTIIYQLKEKLNRIEVKNIQDYKKTYSNKLTEAIGDCIILGDESIKMLVEKENSSINNNLEMLVSDDNSYELLYNAKIRITKDIKSFRKKVGKYNEKKIEKLCKGDYIVPTEGDVEKAIKIAKIVFLDSAFSAIFKYDIIPMEVGVYNLVLNDDRN